MSREKNKIIENNEKFSDDIEKLYYIFDSIINSKKDFEGQIKFNNYKIIQKTFHSIIALAIIILFILFVIKIHYLIILLNFVIYTLIIAYTFYLKNKYQEKYKFFNGKKINSVEENLSVHQIIFYLIIIGGIIIILILSIIGIDPLILIIIIGLSLTFIYFDSERDTENKNT